MKVSFLLEPSDYDGQRRLGRRLWYVPALVANAVPVLLLIPSTAALWLGGFGLLLLAVWGVYLALLLAGSRAAAHTRRRQFADQCVPTSVSVLPGCLETDCEIQWTRWHWSTVHEVATRGDWTAFRLAGSEVVSVPNRAFDSDQQRLDWIEASRQYMAQAGSLEESELDFRQGDGEPEAEVRYTLSSQQKRLLNDFSFGRQASLPWGRRLVPLVLSAMLAATAAAIWPAHQREIWAVAAALVLPMPTWWLIEAVLQYLARRQAQRPRGDDARQVRLWDDGVERRSRMRQAFDSWLTLDECDAAGGFIWLLAARPLVAIPVEAFDNEAAALHFAQQAERLLRQAHEEADAEEADAEEAEEAGNSNSE